jgi:hypothetical protein
MRRKEIFRLIGVPFGRSRKRCYRFFCSSFAGLACLFGQAGAGFFGILGKEKRLVARRKASLYLRAITGIIGR